MSGNASNASFLKTYLNLMSRLREGGSSFARQNPELAPYLDMTTRKSSDPEIERLIESFAFMMAQVEYKSTLSQNEYLIQFIENILPEITQPIPGLVMAKCHVDEKTFESENEAILNAHSLFSLSHSDGQLFYFSNISDIVLSPIDINEVNVASSFSSKDNLYNHKRALVFKLTSLIPINQNKKQKTKFRFYINSDLNNALNIIESILNSKKKIIIVNDSEEKFEISRSNLKIPFDFDNYMGSNNNSNCLYPLFDFCKFYNKYYFFEFTLPEYISFSNNVKIIVPLEDISPYKFEVKSNTFVANCVPLFNFFEKKLKPIRTEKNVYEYPVHADFSRLHTNDIISINDVSTIHPVTNEIQEIVNYHKKSLANLTNPNINSNCFWVARRSFYGATEQSGLIFLRLILTDEISHLPDYLKISAYCTNGKSVSKILPNSKISVESGSLSIEAETLGWIQTQENISDITEKLDTISYLFLINQKILSNNFDDVEDILKAFDILSSTNNSIYIIFQRVLNSVKSIERTARNHMKIWNGNAYHVPGYVFTFKFLSAQSIPLGFFFMLSFLNAFFFYVRGLNFFIQFEHEVEEIREIKKQ